MKKIEITVYAFSELSDKAKEHAISKLEYYDFWGDYRRASYDAAKDIYSRFGDIEREISGRRLYVWIVNNVLPDLTGRKLYEKDWSYYTTKRAGKGQRLSHIFREVDACHLTGYCADWSFLEPILLFLRNPENHISNIDLADTDLENLWELDSQSDYEQYYSEENIEQVFEGCTFLKNGTQY